MADLITIGGNYLTSDSLPLDEKQKPLNTLAELTTVNSTKAPYKGMEIIVLNNQTTNIPVKLIFDGNARKGVKAWTINGQLTTNNFAQIEEFKDHLKVGTNIVVLEDETKNGELSHYIAKSSQEDDVIEIEETKTETMLNEINKIFIITGDDIE
jgi:S-adenosylmethionine:tRNA-ribosyltransferase-isomerase (queuine synthetase)